MHPHPVVFPDYFAESDGVLRRALEDPASLRVADLLSIELNDTCDEARFCTRHCPRSLLFEVMSTGSFPYRSWIWSPCRASICCCGSA